MSDKPTNNKPPDATRVAFVMAAFGMTQAIGTIAATIGGGALMLAIDPATAAKQFGVAATRLGELTAEAKMLSASVKEWAETRIEIAKVLPPGLKSV